MSFWSLNVFSNNCATIVPFRNNSKKCIRQCNFYTVNLAIYIYIMQYIYINIYIYIYMYYVYISISAYIYIHLYLSIYRQINRQIDRQIDRQTDRLIDRQIDRYRYRYIKNKIFISSQVKFRLLRNLQRLNLSLKKQKHYS